MTSPTDSDRDHPSLCVLCDAETYVCAWLDDVKLPLCPDCVQLVRDDPDARALARERAAKALPGPSPGESA